MATPDAPSGGGADEPDDSTAGGGSDPGGANQTPQDVVKATVGLMSQFTRKLDEATAIIAQVNKQFPGSAKQAQMIGQMLAQGQKSAASLMADIVKQTSRQTAPGTAPNPFGG